MFTRILAVIVLCCVSLPARATGAQVSFDLPEAIECRDATPQTFAEAHPALKVIEAKFKISARMLEGNPADIVDFLYVLSSDDKTLRFQDYLPNTTLESAVADDQVEITDSSEKSKATGAEAHVAYKIFTLGASHNQSSKNAECSHYKQLAAKELVLASGTINREHGVFFRLRPSRSASLEGAKEFTFLATVPKSWRGDLCTIACTARANKTTLLSKSVAPTGAEHSQVGMYLVGDAEAAALVEQFFQAQQACAAALAQAAKGNVFETISHQTVGLLMGKKANPHQDVEHARQALNDLRQRIADLAR